MHRFERLPPAPLLLAVSGGRDSMALLHALAASPARGRIAAVATFDHATGPHSRAAVRLVRQTCARLHIPFETATAPSGLRTEAELRAARWAFLRAAAAKHDTAKHAAAIVTAHTDDDQIETVLMRVMRGAGARGLAALYAESDILRPLLDVARADVIAYVGEHHVRYVEDPTNRDLRYFRNRIRHEILPALLRVDSELPAYLRSLARDAAAWRAAVEAHVDSLPLQISPSSRSPVSLSVPLDPLVAHDEPSLRILWPAIAARIGLTLDRRGTIRLAEFTDAGTASGSRIQLSGGWEALRRRNEIVIRRTPEPPHAYEVAELDPNGVTRLGRFRFRPAVPERGARGDHSLDQHLSDPWVAELPADVRLTVRAWRPGDRLRVAAEAEPRRVKRFLSDARIAGADRAGWPVVVAEDRIIWIPGVRRGVLDGTRPEGTTRAYVCDHIER